MTNDTPSLDGWTSLIAGAGRCLGRTMALGLAWSGAGVAVNDVSEGVARRSRGRSATWRGALRRRLPT